MPESSIAPYLTKLHERVRKEGIRVGSYPMLFKWVAACGAYFRLRLTLPTLLIRGVHVSLIGLDEAKIREIGKEVAKELNGKVVEAAPVGEKSNKL